MSVVSSLVLKMATTIGKKRSTPGGIAFAERGWDGGARAHRMLGLAVQALARRLLSRPPATVALVRLLRHAIRHGRDQQHLLPAAGENDVRRVGETCAEGVSLCGQGEPLPDAHEEAEGAGRAAAPAVCPRPAARPHLRAGALSTAAELAGRHPAADRIPPSSAAAAATRDRVSRSELVLRGGLRPADPLRRRAVPARYARLGDRTDGDRAVRLRAVSRTAEVQRPL